MKNGANRTNEIRSDKIQKNGRAELSTEKIAVRQRPEKKREKMQAGNLGSNQAFSSKTFLRDFTS